MSGIVGSRLNNRGSGLIGSLGTDGQVLTSSGAGVGAVYEAVAAGGDLSFGGDTFGADKTIGSNDNYALSFETNATERLKLTNDGRGLSEFTAMVWCHWNGRDTPAIQDSLNCSSITDHDTGMWTVNFTNNLSGGNYAFTTGCSGEFNAYYHAALNLMHDSGTYDSGIKLVLSLASGALFDEDECCVACFGGIV